MKPRYPEPHCLKRNFAAENMYGIEYTPLVVEELLANAATYHDFRLQLERGPHRFIHLGIGGEMPELWSSNGIVFTILVFVCTRADIRNILSDPIFFLHHAQIDRLWWRWQRQGGNGYFREYDDIDGDTGSHDESGLISLHDVLKFNGLGNDVTAGEVLSTETSCLCYKYE